MVPGTLSSSLGSFDGPCSGCPSFFPFSRFIGEPEAAADEEGRDQLQCGVSDGSIFCLKCIVSFKVLSRLRVFLHFLFRRDELEL